MNYSEIYDEKRILNMSKEINEKDKELLKERERNFWLKIVLILSGIGAGIGIGCAIKCTIDLNKAKAMIGDATTRLQSITSVDVDKKLVDDATIMAANQAAQKAVNAAVDGLKRTAEEKVNKGVTEAVEAIKSRLSDAVAAKMAIEVEDISKKDIIEEVVNNTVEQLSKKLEDDLDEELGKAGEIYQNIVNSLA